MTGGEVDIFPVIKSRVPGVIAYNIPMCKTCVADKSKCVGLKSELITPTK